MAKILIIYDSESDRKFTSTAVIMTRDVARFDAAYKRLIKGADFETVTSYVVVGDIKKQSGPPLMYL